jgi:hypothetical protein
LVTVSRDVETWKSSDGASAASAAATGDSPRTTRVAKGRMGSRKMSRVPPLWHVIG